MIWRYLLLLCLLGTGQMALAQTVIATTTIRSQQIIGPEHLTLIEETVAGGIHDPREIIGQEARVNIYSGRPIFAGDLTAPAVIARNEIITLRYVQGNLSILTEGRALDRGAVGDRLRVMNLSSRMTISGQVLAAGLVQVAAGPSSTELARLP